MIAVTAGRRRRTMRQKLQSAVSAWARPATACDPDRPPRRCRARCAATASHQAWSRPAYPTWRGHQSAAVLAPGAPGQRDPILRCELRKLRVEPPAQDVRTLLEAARDGELSHVALDSQQALRLDDRTNVVEDDTGDRRRPPYRQHHGEETAVGGAEEYGRRDLERDQDGREVGECDGKRVVVGIAIVFGPAVAAIIERQDKPRLGGVGRQPLCQRM